MTLAALTGGRGWFEDWAPGQRMRHARGATVGEVENGLVSKQVMNTAQAHWNEHYLPGPERPSGEAARSGVAALLGSGRVVFGLVTASMVFGLASQDTAEQALCELGCGGLRFLAPVHHGDTLFALTEVQAVEPAPDRDDAGVVRFHHWGVDQEERLVFEGDRTVLIKRFSHWGPR